jgi:hypothetical protein
MCETFLNTTAHYMVTMPETMMTKLNPFQMKLGHYILQLNFLLVSTIKLRCFREDRFFGWNVICPNQEKKFWTCLRRRYFIMLRI